MLGAAVVVIVLLVILLKLWFYILTGVIGLGIGFYLGRKSTRNPGKRPRIIDVEDYERDRKGFL